MTTEEKVFEPSRHEIEIAKLVEEIDAQGKQLHPALITHELIRRHTAGLARQNEHTDHIQHYWFKGLRKDVGSYITKRFGDERQANDNQNVLPGFEYVQRRYVVTRGGDDIAVLVEDMTDLEIEAKAKLLRRRGKACLAHADELERFKSLRSQAA